MTKKKNFQLPEWGRGLSLPLYWSRACGIESIVLEINSTHFLIIRLFNKSRIRHIPCIVLPLNYINILSTMQVCFTILYNVSYID